jgi:hypothetical protein
MKRKIPSRSQKPEEEVLFFEAVEGKRLRDKGTGRFGAGVAEAGPGGSAGNDGLRHRRGEYAFLKRGHWPRWRLGLGFLHFTP